MPPVWPGVVRTAAYRVVGGPVRQDGAMSEHPDAPPQPDEEPRIVVITPDGMGVAQQMAAQQQLAGMRRALPPGHPAAQDGSGMPGGPGMPGMAHPDGAQGQGGPTGQYL